MSSSDSIRVQRIGVFQITEITRGKIQLLTGHLCDISEPWYEGWVTLPNILITFGNLLLSYKVLFIESIDNGISSGLLDDRVLSQEE